MSKKISYADITNSHQNEQQYKPLDKQFRPSRFLNDLESVPANFVLEKRFDDVVVDYMYPQTARRRIAIGNDSKITKSECVLPSLQNSSIHKNLQSFPSYKEDLRRSEILRTDDKQTTELENINRKIKKIINSNRRQVTFQSSLIVIDEQNQITKIQDPQQLKDQQTRRKTIVRQKTVAI